MTLLDCPPPPPAAYEVLVEDVTDGDTFTLSSPILGMDTVRLVGVDTPETVDPDQAPEPGGKEASEFTTAQLVGEPVLISPAEDPEDPYGRLLAYSWTPDGAMFNERLLAEGYGEALTIAPNDEFQSCLEAAESRAKAESRGLWSDRSGGLLGLLESLLRWL